MNVVPPLLLQLMVENAVKHGIAGLIEGGTVTVRIQVEVTDKDSRVAILRDDTRLPISRND